MLGLVVPLGLREAKVWFHGMGKSGPWRLQSIGCHLSPCPGGCPSPYRALCRTHTVSWTGHRVLPATHDDSSLCSLHPEVKPAQRLAPSLTERLQVQVCTGHLPECAGLLQPGALHRVPAAQPASRHQRPSARAHPRGAPNAALPGPRLRPLWQHQVQWLLQWVLSVQADVRLTQPRGPAPGPERPRALARGVPFSLGAPVPLLRALLCRVGLGCL